MADGKELLTCKVGMTIVKSVFFVRKQKIKKEKEDEKTINDLHYIVDIASY
jgi:hypothetical protein